MLAHLHRSLSLLEICEVVGASERTLLYAFRERTGQLPKAYLNALKLNRLRQALKDADPRVDSVHEVARHWGLVHSGSLAADYRRLFGELPHQTLQWRRRQG
jgi:AraC family transcriptional regulator, ethanolamine operon transcriptional activator